MVVHWPATNANGILEIAIQSENILLGQDVVAHHSAAFTLARNHSHPVHAPIGAARFIAGVFDVIPDSHHDRKQLESDPFVIANCVELSSPLDPPVAILPGADRTKAQMLRGDRARPFWSFERDRTPIIPGGEKDAAP